MIPSVYLFLQVSLVLFASRAVYATDNITADGSSSLLPTCAGTCFATAIGTSNCSVTNQSCICADTALSDQALACSQKTCTPMEFLVTLNMTSITCNVTVRDKRLQFNEMSIAFTSVSGCVVGLRMLQRILWGPGMSGLFVDDYLIVIAYIIGIPGSAINVNGLTANGLGKDVWTLSFKQITDFLRFTYVNEIIYFTELFFVKLCILVFYLRIFPATTIRRLIWGTIVFDLAALVVFAFVTIFQCNPISLYWEGWDGLHEGTCLSINGLVWVNAAISIATDFWMLALPLSQLRHLQLHWKRKLGVALMFGVGLFVTGVSILRLQFLVEFGDSTNPTWDQYSTCYWSTVEINVAVCCACMPSLRLLLVKIFPKLGGGSAGRSRSEAPIGLTLCPRRGVERAAAADAATDPSQKILYSRGFQVQYSDARGGPHGEGDGSSTAELVDRDVEVAKSGTWKAPRSHMSL